MTFLYTTFKYCSIKDRRLGLYYYIGILAVVLYTILTIFINKGYLDIDTTPQGSVTLISDSLANISIPYKHYCCIKGESWGDNPGCKAKCFVIDGKELAWPLDKDSVTISSFFKERKQILHPGSLVTENAVEVQYYSKTPEAADIKVEHSIHSYHAKITGTQRTMKGVLLSQNDTVIKTFNSFERADRFHLNDIIIASGLGSLDEISDSPNGNGKAFRRKGCLLLVSIFYHNVLSSVFGTTPLQYTYKVERVPYTPYRVEEIVPISSSINSQHHSAEDRYTRTQYRILRKRYGVHVKFIQHGKIGRFSLAQLLQCLATSVSLFTLITTVGDVVALYLLPQSKFYRDIIYGMRDEDLVDHTKKENEPTGWTSCFRRGSKKDN